MKKNDKIVDCEKLSDRKLLDEMTKRIIKYDKLRDKELLFIGKHPDLGDLTEKQMERYENLKLEIDNAWCRLREVIRVVKKDPNFWA